MKLTSNYLIALRGTILCIDPSTSPGTSVKQTRFSTLLVLLKTVRCARARLNALATVAGCSGGCCRHQGDARDDVISLTLDESGGVLVLLRGAGPLLRTPPAHNHAAAYDFINFRHLPDHDHIPLSAICAYIPRRSSQLSLSESSCFRERFKCLLTFRREGFCRFPAF